MAESSVENSDLGRPALRGIAVLTQRLGAVMHVFNMYHRGEQPAEVKELVTMVGGDVVYMRADPTNAHACANIYH